MKTRVNELYKEICIPKPRNFFVIVDEQKGDTVEEKVPHGTLEQDIIVFFVT